LAKFVAALHNHNDEESTTHAKSRTCSTYHLHHRHDVLDLVFALGNARLLTGAGTIAVCPSSAHWEFRILWIHVNVIYSRPSIVNAAALATAPPCLEALRAAPCAAMAAVERALALRPAPALHQPSWEHLVRLRGAQACSVKKGTPSSSRIKPTAMGSAALLLIARRVSPRHLWCPRFREGRGEHLDMPSLALLCALKTMGGPHLAQRRRQRTVPLHWSSTALMAQG
jgi:hypothetical protein